MSGKRKLHQMFSVQQTAPVPDTVGVSYPYQLSVTVLSDMDGCLTGIHSADTDSGMLPSVLLILILI